MASIEKGAKNVAQVSLKPHKTSGKRASGGLSRTSYSDAQVERALIEVACANGNTHQAARELASDGFQIDQKTLWRWSTKLHLERYCVSGLKCCQGSEPELLRNTWTWRHDKCPCPAR